MKPKLRAFLASALLAAFSATEVACSERPQRVVLEGDSAHSESWDGQQRDRTLKQGESGRMSY
jgi:hypothetical protein